MSLRTPWHLRRAACSYRFDSLFCYLGNLKAQQCRLQCLFVPNARLEQIRNFSHSLDRDTKLSSTLEGDLKENQSSFGKKTLERVQELKQSWIEQYPRISNKTAPSLSLQAFRDKYEGESSLADSVEATVVGRISSSRKAGSKLFFVDIQEQPGHHHLQLVLQADRLSNVHALNFNKHTKIIRRGDVISATGLPYRTEKGELSLRLTSLPTILSPSLHTIPVKRDNIDPESIDRHVQMLINPTIIQDLQIRSMIIQHIREFFKHRDFHEVQTPILAAVAGGATARAFETTATEFTDRKLSLRIAPELWLKRLIIGGMSKVFEIGPSFRNEGLDKTHNPEFSTCEFYAVYHSLEDLQNITEALLSQLSSVVQAEAKDVQDGVQRQMMASLQNQNYAKVDFIPALNSRLKFPLPNLSSATARAEIIAIFESYQIPLPQKPTLPRLLDNLSSHFLEPACTGPTWITNIPECLSPLAKSFVHPTAPNDQLVAARAELFVGGHEIVNCYEEENSPFEQRHKFIRQQQLSRIAGTQGTKHREESIMQGEEADNEAMKLDEDYLRALEWGLPPTGGWGCGIDRLVMLLTGKDRIGDVLSFGSLRAVTRGAQKWDKKSPEEE